MTNMKISDEFSIDKAPSISPVPLVMVDGCRWPIEAKKGTLFCNDEKHQPLSSYCLYHAKLVYQPRRGK